MMLVLAGQKEAVAADSIAFGASLLDRSCERKNCHILIHVESLFSRSSAVAL